MHVELKQQRVLELRGELGLLWGGIASLRLLAVAAWQDDQLRLVRVQALRVVNNRLCLQAKDEQKQTRA